MRLHQLSRSVSCMKWNVTNVPANREIGSLDICLSRRTDVGEGNWVKFVSNVPTYFIKFYFIYNFTIPNYNEDVFIQVISNQLIVGTHSSKVIASHNYYRRIKELE